MAYLGVLESIRARLEGRDEKFVPPLSEDVITAWQEHLTSLELQNLDYRNNQTVVPMQHKRQKDAIVGSVRVPVYFFDVQGALQPGLVYPSLTYEVIDFTPRYAEYLWSRDDFGGNVYCEPVDGSTEDVIDEDGVSLGESERLVRQREIEHPFDIIVEIRAYSRDPFESAMLVKYIFDRFPPRHFIRVPQRDGTYRSWDMLHETYQDLDKRDAVRSGSPGTDREYAKVLTYRIEGYLDNTDTSRLVQLNRRRIIAADEL